MANRSTPRPRTHSPIAAQPGETLSLLDQQIVAALQIAPRASWQQIATALEVSESTVSRHAKTLLASERVRVSAMPDPIRCGLGFPVLLQLGCAVGEAEQVAARLAQRPDVRFVALLSGSHDIVVELVVPSRFHLAEVVLNELNQIPGIVRSSSEVVVRNFKFSYDWARGLLGDRVDRLPVAPTPAGPPRPTKVDEHDLTLVQLLAEDGRTSAAELAKLSDLSESSVRRRVEALTASGALHFATFIDPMLMGFQAPLFLWLNVDLRHLEEVAHALSEQVAVRYVSASAGDSDLIAEVILPDLDHVYDFLTTVVGPLPGIRRSDVALELGTVKRGYLT